MNEEQENLGWHPICTRLIQNKGLARWSSTARARESGSVKSAVPPLRNSLPAGNNVAVHFSETPSFFRIGSDPLDAVPNAMISYASTTRGITVTVRPIYLDEPSDLLEREFAFGYAIQIENTSPNEVQLLRRRWIIEAGNGSRQDLTGDGALRPHPVIAPGETHVHDGSCTIESFRGTVEGNYLVQRADGEQFRVSVPPFPLHAAAN